MGKLTAQDRLKIVELEKSGMSQCNIAKQYNVTAQTVYSVISKYKHGGNLQGTNNNHRLSEQEKENLIDDLKHREERGLTVLQLAAKYNVAEHTIHEYIRKNNLQLKKDSYRLSDEQKQSIYEQFTSGISAVELSKRFNICVNTVYKIVNALKDSNEQFADTIKLIKEQFQSELSNGIDHTFIDNIDRVLISDSTAKLIDDMENEKERLFKLYKEYCIGLIKYAESADAISKSVKAEMEEKYKYLQSKLERKVS